MVNIQRLREVIDDSGLKMTAIAEKSGMKRETLYNRLAGVGEFTASEIIGLASTLHLSPVDRDQIFLE